MRKKKAHRKYDLTSERTLEKKKKGEGKGKRHEVENGMDDVKPLVKFKNQGGN